MTGDYYDELAGSSDPARAVGWRHHLEQALRFEAVADLLDQRPTTLIDVGCGDAALADYLESTGRTVSYVGVEQHPTLAARARSRRPCDTILEADALGEPLPRGDCVVAIGTFVSGGAMTEDGRRARLDRLVEALWRACRQRAALVVLRPEALAQRPGLALETALVGASAAELCEAAISCGASSHRIDDGVTGLDRMLVMARAPATLPELRATQRRLDAVLASCWGQQSEADARAWLAWEAGLPESARALLEEAGDTPLARLLRERIASR